MSEGIFLVIDGTDGSGKATQTELLVERLLKLGHSVKTLDFPQYGTPGAAMAEHYLNGNLGGPDDVNAYQASILFAVDRFSAAAQIRNWLQEGHTIIANRYTSSNMGHQAGKIVDLEERSKFMDWLNEFEFSILNLPRPNATILLYLDPLIGQERVDSKGYRSYVKGNKRDIHEADKNHLLKAAEAYKWVAEKYSWDIVDASGTIADVHERVWETVKALLS